MYLKLIVTIFIKLFGKLRNNVFTGKSRANIVNHPQYR